MLQRYSWAFEQTNSIKRSALKRTRLAFFPSKRLNITVINSFLQKLSNWLPAKSNISTTIDFCCLQVWHFWEQLQRAAQSALTLGIGTALLFPLGDVYCPYTKYSGKLCLHKETFQSLGRSVYQCPQGASACRVSDFSFEEQTSSFFSSFGQGVHILEENSVSIQDVIGALFCVGKYCSNRKKCECIGGYVTTRYPFKVVESVEPGCLFRKFFFCYKST